MKESFENRLNRARRLIGEADRIIVGGGSGLSTAAGLCYGGERFSENFPEYIARYGMTDMYTAGFYPFGRQEEKWAYWSRHVYLNRFRPPALPLYLALERLVRGREYFVLTTNVDHQFHKAGFDESRIFCVQGDYGEIQCAKGCHAGVYPNEELISDMVSLQRNCEIPSELVPKCPVCGGDMEIHIRKDGYFVQDGAWEAAAGRFDGFRQASDSAKTVLLELGVGFNTPGIVRFPFERMAYRRKDTYLLRVNLEHWRPVPENAEKTVAFCEDMAEVIGGWAGEG